MWIIHFVIIYISYCGSWSRKFEISDMKYQMLTFLGTNKSPRSQFSPITFFSSDFSSACLLNLGFNHLLYFHVEILLNFFKFF